LGKHFAVIGRPDVLNCVSDETQQIWRDADVLRMPTQDPALLGWLDEHGFAAIMLRPDRYIMGTARTSAELDAVAACLCAAALQSN
jgi:3-(3-hydroxy-phenyl)propionate hydroxylase